MKISEQLLRNLSGLGFEEIKPNLFTKKLSENLILYRDYRNEKPITYAYLGKSRVNPIIFKETQAIEKIERFLNQEDIKLSSYT